MEYWELMSGRIAAMKNKTYHVGIDTSAYTTSIAIIDSDFNVLKNLKYMLKVENGKKGLRQQEAVFQHIMNLSRYIEEAFSDIDNSLIETISCSNKPRNLEDSYMPVFLVSELIAKTMGSMLNITPSYFSHQEGHLGVVVDHLDKMKIEKFIGLHFSGGTSEILEIEMKNFKFDIKIIGGTLDISFGKFIDRIGVALGFDFPAGKYIEGLNASNQTILKQPISVKEGWFNLSGAETYLLNEIDRGVAKEEIACATEQIMEKTLLRALENIIEDKKQYIIFTGGVASNTRLRRSLLAKYGEYVIIPEKSLCTDNAVGLAKLGLIGVKNSK